MGSDQLGRDPIEYARTLLGIDKADVSIDELIQQLVTIRLKYHPDRYSDEEAKRNGEETFKVIGQLMVDLDKMRQHQIVKTPISTLAKQVETPVGTDYRIEIASLQIENRLDRK